jgi:glycosyltransferase involved in cell wall biosynthesis
MKILCVNCIISEFGGVEFAAINLARKLADRGHEVHFLGASGIKSQMEPKSGAGELRASDRLHLHFRGFPRIYPLGERHDAVRNLIWHVQDLLHPANERVFGQVLRDVSPDIVILHNITAIGLNIWRTIAKAGVPCVQVVHDLGLVCLNLAQFRGGKACAGLCTACKIYKSARFSMIDRKDPFAFVAPSQGILNVINRHVDLTHWPQAVIPNANTFEVDPRQTTLDPPELLYVGRLDPSKGVAMMLEAASRARRRSEFKLNLLGTGSLETDLRRSYADADWVVIHGSVPQEQVAKFMARASLLLIPSLWPETVPGVAVHALYAGLPAMGSRIGGIPEHIMVGKTGFLLPPGDVEAWQRGIENALGNPALLDAFSAEGPSQARRFDADLAVATYEKFMDDHVKRSEKAKRTGR